MEKGYDARDLFKKLNDLEIKHSRYINMHKEKVASFKLDIKQKNNKLREMRD